MGRHESAMTWTSSEDARLLVLISKQGVRWTSMRKHFPGRSVASIRNRWMRVQRAHDRGVRIAAPGEDLQTIALELGFDLRIEPDRSLPVPTAVLELQAS